MCEVEGRASVRMATSWWEQRQAIQRREIVCKLGRLFVLEDAGFTWPQFSSRTQLPADKKPGGLTGNGEAASFEIQSD